MFGYDNDIRLDMLKDGVFKQAEQIIVRKTGATLTDLNLETMILYYFISQFFKRG